MKPFSRMEAMRFGWETVENNLRFFIPFYILFLLSFYVVYFVVYFIGLLISEITGLNQVLVDVVSLIVSYLFLLLLSLGFIKVSLKFYDGERASFGDLFSQYRLFFGASFAVIIYILAVFGGPLLLIVPGIIIATGLAQTIAVLGGIFLLIIPGIIIATKLAFILFFIVDGRVGPIESLKRSWAITKGVKFKLYIFFLMTAGLNTVGMLFFFVGLIFTYPVTMLATAFVYRKLLERAQGASMYQSAPLADEAMPLQR